MESLISNVSALPILNADKAVSDLLADHLHDITFDQRKIRPVALSWAIVKERSSLHHDNHAGCVGGIILHGGTTRQKHQTGEEQKSEGFFHEGVKTDTA
jgi:hypothetical protein